MLSELYLTVKRDSWDWIKIQRSANMLVSKALKTPKPGKVESKRRGWYMGNY